MYNIKIFKNMTFLGLENWYFNFSTRERSKMQHFRKYKLNVVIHTWLQKEWLLQNLKLPKACLLLPHNSIMSQHLKDHLVKCFACI